MKQSRIRARGNSEPEFATECALFTANMLDDNDAGAAYLNALKQSAGAAAAPAPAVETKAPQPAGTTYSSLASTPWQEKRKSPRYSCDGSARMQRPGGASTWARFTDISLHGCYIETAGPYSIGTNLELKLEAHDIRVEATGQVRVSYPGLGMGVAFMKISEQEQSHLQELLRRISARDLTAGVPVDPQPSSFTDPLLVSQAESSSAPNPRAVLQELMKFFESRHMLGRDEFLRILRTSR